VINLFSVPHTGTLFLKGVIERSGIDVRARHWEGWEPSDELIVAPIRNPYDTYVSWVSRGRDQDFKEKWEIFNDAFMSNQKMVIVPIDAHNRDDYLNLLSNALGVTVKTDWTPVNIAASKDIGPVDLSDIYNLPVVKQFYTQDHLTRRQAEKIVRQVMQKHAGEKMERNLFINSVNLLMEEANK